MKKIYEDVFAVYKRINQMKILAEISSYGLEVVEENRSPSILAIYKESLEDMEKKLGDILHEIDNKIDEEMIVGIVE